MPVGGKLILKGGRSLKGPAKKKKKSKPKKPGETNQTVLLSKTPVQGVNPLSVSVQSGKTYEEEFEIETKRADMGKGRSTPWGTSFAKGPKILHGYTKEITGDTAEERLDIRCAKRTDKFFSFLSYSSASLFSFIQMVTEPKDILKKLASSDTASQCEAVRCLKNEIIGNPNRKQCFIRLGAVPRIVRILGSPLEQRLAVQAAAALGSFAYQNTDGVAAIVESGGVAHLLKALSNADVKLVEASVRSLKMIFQSEQAPRDIIFVHPAFDRLVEFLDMQEKRFAEDALTIFAKCCKTKQHQDLLQKSGALPRMIKLLFSPVSSVQQSAMEVLMRMSYKQAEISSSILEKDDVVKTLMRFVRGRDVDLQFSACALLANLSASLTPSNISMGWFSSEVTETLVQLLEVPSLISLVPGTIATIAENRRDLQQLISDAGGFRTLWKFLTMEEYHDDIALQIVIVQAIGVMCQHLESCRREIVTSRTIWRMLSLMDSQATELRNASLECFQMVATCTNKPVEEGAYPVTDFSTDLAVRLKEYACTALAMLVSERSDPEANVDDALDFLSRYVWSPEPSVRYKAIWGLKAIILTIPKDNCKKYLPLLDDALWNTVRQMVQDPAKGVQEEGLSFLEALVRSNDGIGAAIDWSNGELLPLIAQTLDPSNWGNARGITLALTIAASISNSDVEHQTAVMGSGIPPRLLTCLEQRWEKSVKIAAVKCVVNLTFRDVLPWGSDDRSAECRAKALLELGIEEVLSKLEKEHGSELLTKLVKDAIGFLGQLE